MQPMEAIGRTKKEHERHFSSLRFPQSPLRCQPTPHRPHGTAPTPVATPHSTAMRRRMHRRGTSPLRVPKSFKASLAVAAESERRNLQQYAGTRYQPDPADPANQLPRGRHVAKIPISTQLVSPCAQVGKE